jgi:hypothetical protein
MIITAERMAAGTFLSSDYVLASFVADMICRSSLASAAVRASAARLHGKKSGTPLSRPFHCLK